MNTLIDVQNTAIAAQSDLINGDAPGYTYSFLVTNTGNARDRFDLTAGFTHLSAPVASLWIDTNHNNLFDPQIDTRIDANGNGIVLAPGASVNILVLSTARGEMALTATSLNEDPLAIVAHRAATAKIAVTTPVIRILANVRLVKTQSVDTLGAAGPGRGSIITYTLAPAFPKTGRFTNVHITDVIPTGTTYVPGSLTIDDAPLSDAADSDAGAFDTTTNSISVALSGTEDSSQVVRFQVRIK